MKTLCHKGYHARVAFDAEDGLLVGHIAGIEDVIGFHADTVADLKAAFVEAVEDYLETCVRLGKDPQKPYSGKLMLRISPQVHAEAALAAQLAGVSLNQWSETVLREAAGRATVPENV